MGMCKVSRYRVAMFGAVEFDVLSCVVVVIDGISLDTSQAQPG